MMCSAKSELIVALAILACLAGAASGASSDRAFQALRKALVALGFDASAIHAATGTAPLEVTKASQDWAVPTPDLACHTLTPITIGTRTFAHGIGAHAKGLVSIRLAQPATRFHAFVGIDNNWDTAGTRGSVEFVVRADGREAAWTPVCRGGEEARELSVDLRGVGTLDLVVTDGGDGFSYDQADWADATVVLESGRVVELSEVLGSALPCPFFDRPPTRFSYGGRDCWSAFEGWQSEDLPTEHADGVSRHARRWTEPGTGFAATLITTVYEDTPAVELGWQLDNVGDAESNLISELRSVDLAASAADGRARLVSCSGGLTGTLDGSGEHAGFELAETQLGTRTLGVSGGRSSNGDLPFFMLTGLPGGWGMAVGLGWSGQWSARAVYVPDVGEALLTAGMEPVHFRLPPGSSVALPTALLVPFAGQDSTGSNAMRRVLRIHYQAELDARPVDPPVSFNSWFVFDNRITADMLCDLADKAAALGVEFFCIDAGWFDGDFPNGVGNWIVNSAKFPQGVRQVADHVHGLGMKLGLWFEPERVASGTRWAIEHPDLVTGDLLDLGRPEARALELDMLDSIISENGVDWIRYDFNTDPLAAWTRLEDDDHRGLRQIMHINGLYDVLDELMRRHPGLLIEQCSSGGRRIDLETIRRGHTFWKSDNTHDQRLMRFHETGGNVFLPGGLLNTNLLSIGSQGELLGLFAGPLGFGADFRGLTEAQADTVRLTVAAYKRVRHLIDEDYYPLLRQSTDPAGWNAWEFLDPDAGEGLVVAYRQPGSPYFSATLRLLGIDTADSYQAENLLTAKVEPLPATAALDIRLATDEGMALLLTRR